MLGVQETAQAETSDQDEELVHYALGYNRCLQQRLDRIQKRCALAEQERDALIRERECLKQKTDELDLANQQLQEQLIRLESRNDERGLPRVCTRCRSNTVIVTCRCGETLLENKPYPI